MTEQEKKAMLDAMKKDNEGGNRKYWNIPSKAEGVYPIRILPPLTNLGEKTFYKKHHVHWINGKAYECLNQTMSYKDGKFHEAESCPICNFVQKLYKTAEKGDDDWELAGKLRAKERTVSRIVVRGSEDETDPKFYEYGPTIFKMLYHIMTETDFGVIVDPKNGRDFNLTKVGTGRRSRYETSTPSANSGPIFKDAESLKKLFVKASKMKYEDLFDFVSAETMRKALENYLGNDEPEEYSRPSPPKKEETYLSKNEKFNEPVSEDTPEPEEPEETIDEDDIDSILSEFTG